jgi:hypothetical protein
MTELIVKSILTLSSIAGLLYLVLYLIRKYSPASRIFSGTGADAIKINSVSYLDSNSKIVNFSCSKKKYLILLGKNNDILIDKYDE